MEQFTEYPSLPSGDSDTEPKPEPDMEQAGSLGENPLEVMMRQIEQMEIRLKQREEESEALWRELQATKKKEENRAYVQTWRSMEYYLLTPMGEEYYLLTPRGMKYYFLTPRGMDWITIWLLKTIVAGFTI